MIELVRPETYLLALPLLVWLWRRGGMARQRPLVGVLRTVALLSLLTLLAEPYVTQGSAGRDLVLLVDRSRSVGGRAATRARELAAQACAAAQPGDRLAVVSFGGDAAVEEAGAEATSDLARALTFERALDADATDLEGGLERALALIPAQRRGSVLLVSDGEGTGGRPALAARAALRRGVRIDAVPVRRSGGLDVAVEEVALPAEVSVDEPFRGAVWVRSAEAVTVPFELQRDGVTIASGTRELQPGLNRIAFRDRLPAAGVHGYVVRLLHEADAVPENDMARAVVRVRGPSRVLVVRDGGAAGGLASVLQAAGVEVQVTAPEVAPLYANQLDGFEVVVLENVPIEDLPPGGPDALAYWVEEFGGGLLMTGGRASFGLGGYHKSVIEPVLPVSLEIRQEQRRFGLAMAFALDRSGSMGAPAGAGRTKMDLANLGTVAAVEMLGPIDACAVIAVDSSPHVVVSMRDVEDAGAIIDSVRRIESGGGGIYVYTSLVAMAEELAETDHSTRHMVLFADAADAEEPGDYKKLVPQLRSAGITLSVIALGDPSDGDARFLMDLARLGGGRCKFVKEVRHLPRVFAQETLQIARSSFVQEATGLRARSGGLALGEVDFSDMPGVGGYSVAYLRDGASLALQTTDEIQAPALSFWQRGLGRSAAFLGTVDGEFSTPFVSWSGYGDLFVTLVRWLGGSRANEQVWAELRREGHEAVLEIEVAEGAEAELAAIRARLRVDGEIGTQARALPLRRVDARRLEARMPLESAAVHRAALELSGNRALVLPPVVLPYSPEFEPRPDPRSGERTLGEVVELTGGRIDPPADSLFDGPRDGVGQTPLAPLAGWVLLFLLLAEIAVRRLELGLPGWLRLPSRIRARRRASPVPDGSEVGRPVRTAAAAARVAADRPVRREPDDEEASAPAAPSPSSRPPSDSDQDDRGARLGSVLGRAQARAARRR